MSKGIIETVGGAALVAGAITAIVLTGGAATPAMIALAHIAPALLAAGAGLVMTGIGTMLTGKVQGFATTTRNPIAPWEIVYGRSRVGGTIVYLAEFGDKNKWLDMVVVLAAHSCDSVTELLFDNQRVQIGHFSDGSGFNMSFTPLQQTVLIASPGDITRSGSVVTVVLHHDIPLLTDGDQLTIQGVHPVSLLFNGKFPVFDVIHTPGSPGDVTFSYLSGGPAVPPAGPVLGVPVTLSGQVKTTWADYKKNIYLETIGDSGPYNRLGHPQGLGETFVGMMFGTPKQGDTTTLVQNDRDANNNATLANPWSNYCSLVGMTAAFIRLEYDPALFPAGIPQISFLIKGKNDVWDPRTSPPSGGYTENAALCIADYLTNKTYGFKCDYDTDIHAANLIAAANICDEAVALAEPVVSPPHTEPRYTCCGHFNVSLKRGEVLQNLLTSCAGRITFIAGQFSIWPAIWPGVSTALASDWTIKNAAGPIKWRSSVSISNLFNGVKGTYISPVNNWQSSDFPRYAQDALHGYDWSTSDFQNDQNLENDGGDRRWKDIQLPFTISCPTAQRLAAIELKRLRQQGTGTFLLNMAGYQLAPMDVVSLSLAYFGWTDKYFEILAVRFKLDKQQDAGSEVTLLGVEIDVQETDPSVYDWEAIEELSPQGYQQPGVPDTLLTPDPPSNLNVTFDPGGHAVLNWTAPLDAYVTEIQGRYQPVASPPGIWIELATVPDSVTQMLLPSLLAGHLYVLELRAVNAAGVPSIWVALDYTPISLPPQWEPYQVGASSDDALYPGEHTFDVALSYSNLSGGQTSLADGSSLARAVVTGDMPVNRTAGPAPIITAAVVSATGGTIPDGVLLYITVTADDGAGNYTLPAAVFQVAIPAASPPGNTNSVSLDVVWPDFAGLVQYTIYAAANQVDLVCAQTWGNPSLGGPAVSWDDAASVWDTVGATSVALALTGSPPVLGPTTIVLASAQRGSWAPPNPNLRTVRLKGTIGYHLGVLGAGITSVIGDTITSTDCIDVAATDDWTGRILAIIGRNNSGIPLSSVPFWSANITAFDPATGVFTLDRAAESSPPSDSDPAQGDAFVVCTKGYDNSSDPYQVTDAGWSNSLNYDFATKTPTPHSGLTVDLEQGMVLRVIRGTSRGAKANILANTGTTHVLDAPILLAADSVWVIVESGWPYAMDSVPIDNANPFQSMMMVLPIPNFSDQSLLLGPFLVDITATESEDGDGCFRMFYVYGRPAPSFNFARAILPGVQAVAADILANRYHVKIPEALTGSKIQLYSVTITAKIKPASADSVYDVLMSNDDGVTWTSLLPTLKATLPSTVQNVTLLPAWAVPFLFDGDQLRIDCLAADGTVSGVELLFGGSYVPI